MEQGTYTPKEEKKEGGSGGCFISFVVVLAIFVAVFLVLAAAQNGGEGLGRAATTGDVTINCSESGLLAIKVVVVPKHDIKNLEITVSCYDKNKNLVKEIPVQFGNVKKSNQYQQDVSISNFSLSEMFNISYYRCTVTDGTVPLLG